MTHTLHKTSLAAILAMFSVFANTADFSKDGVFYDIISDTEVEVCVAESVMNSYNGSVTIPTTVEYEGKSYAVTSIAPRAFRFSSKMTSVTIPASVTYICTGAFRNSQFLTSVDIGSGVTSIGVYAFNGCERLASIDIPSSVTSIGYGAFAKCTSLTSVTVQNSKMTIDDNVFEGCTSLKR